MIMMLMMQQHERPQRSRSKGHQEPQQHSLHQLSVQVIQPSSSPRTNNPAGYTATGSGTTISTAGRSTSSHMLHQPVQQRANRPTTLQCEEPQENIHIAKCNAPLYRRLFNYIREAWTGVRSALGISHTDIKSIQFSVFCIFVF